MVGRYGNLRTFVRFLTVAESLAAVSHETMVIGSPKTPGSAMFRVHAAHRFPFITIAGHCFPHYFPTKGSAANDLDDSIDKTIVSVAKDFPSNPAATIHPGRFRSLHNRGQKKDRKTKREGEREDRR